LQHLANVSAVAAHLGGTAIGHGQAMPQAPTIVNSVRNLHDVAYEALSRARGIASTVRGPIPHPLSDASCPPRPGFDLGASLDDLYATLSALNGQLVEVQNALGDG
jgi:hypothetical protein